MDSTLDLLKLRLMLQRLDKVSSVSLHPLIIDEANRAAVIALTTHFPLLLFPCLFEERVAAALERDRQRRRIYWSQLEGIRRAAPALQMV